MRLAIDYVTGRLVSAAPDSHWLAVDLLHSDHDPDRTLIIDTARRETRL